MEFCLCGNSTCICETSCTCLQRGCLCYKCHRLRKEEWSLPFESITPSEFELFSPSKELAQSFSEVGISECEFSSRLPATDQEIHRPSSLPEVSDKVTRELGSIPGSSSEVANEVIIESVPGSSFTNEVLIESVAGSSLGNEVIVETVAGSSFGYEITIEPGSSFGNEVIIETTPGLSFEVASEVIIESVPDSSTEVNNEVVIESESSLPKIEPTAEDLQQVPPNKKLIPAEQDIGTNKLFQHKPCSSKYSTRKDSACKAPHRRKKRVHKTNTRMKGKSTLLKDDSESSWGERYIDYEAEDLLTTRFLREARNHESVIYLESAENYESDPKKSSSDTSSTSNGSSSGVSIIDFPDDEWDPDALPYLPDNHLIGISSVRFAPRHIYNSHLQQQESTTPTMMLGEENEHKASSGRSISPIEMFTRNPTAVVSYSGELYILPLRKCHSPSSPPRTLSPLMDVSQSFNTSKESSDSTVKVSVEAGKILSTDMQNSEKLQTECREKTTSLESSTSNVLVNEQEKDDACLAKRENLSEKNSTDVSDKKFKPDK